ncbi:siroheme synthase [Vibrio europaeus]|uniref:precorrin-2 dehydrogenase n=1 Tax=Vibrio europaeus TaxID=300876 RepID=A0A178JG16_9VIBR|nr:bifunctional precorrin-2 dehydrogenase/sirohydrochlorin ferrochelatase [Vibrio europaeus]MDC5706357.1 siroheme synthase [Vibrio europaeus]MDC5711672.1 siroheme synthase [Vibrio europaeus]MDC5716147.1 siroheme synthase [Vibrio europaeus]MDC5720903.1 siroheme synthase [Vibrio europaeus]MDC5723226.1 siroheme synthase [Vibrio europaeus]
MQYFPLFIDLNHKPVLVVGGGEVASRKVDSLIRAGADVTIVSPQVEDYLAKLVANEECRWVQGFYSEELLEQKYVQVWATTDNPNLNHQVHHDAKRKGILVNVVDDQPYCDFITPSIINRGRIQLAISSGGAAPVLIRNVREKLEAVLPQNLSLQAEFAASKRADIKEKLPTVDDRRKFWEAFFARADVDKATANSGLERAYQALLSEGFDQKGSITWIEHGDDVELLTLKALRLMQQAELVLFDGKCPFSFIDLVRRDAERVEYHNDAELAEMLNKARADDLRVAVFIPPKSSGVTFLQGEDLLLRLGAGK